VKYTFLLGDFLAHTMDTYSPLTLAYHLLKPNSLNKRTNVAIQIFIIFLGCVSSVAEARTCKHNMDKDSDSSQTLETIETTSTPKGRGDIWIKISCLMDGTCIFLNNLIFMGALIDNINKDVEITDLSLLALIFGIVWGCLIAFPSAHCHFMLNSNHQSK